MGKFLQYIAIHGFVEALLKVFGRWRSLQFGQSGSLAFRTHVFGEVFDIMRLPSHGDKHLYLLTDQNLRLKEFKQATRLMTSNELPASKISDGLFLVLYKDDEKALEEIRNINRNGGKFCSPQIFEKTQYRFTDLICYEALKRSESQLARISHFNYKVHENICEAIKLTRGIVGDYVEIGVYKGGSALTALNYLALSNEVLDVFLIDTFEGFSYPQAGESNDVIWAGTHKLYGVDDTMTYIRSTLELAQYDFSLFAQNIINESLPPSIQTIRVANIDVDIYEATEAALQAVAPKMAKHGIIICEDPASTPGLYGAYLAMEDFLETSLGRTFLKVFKDSQYFLIRM